MNRTVKTGLVIAIIAQVAIQNYTFSVNLKEKTLAFLDLTKKIIELDPIAILSFLQKSQQDNKDPFFLRERLQATLAYKDIYHPNDTSNRNEVLAIIEDHVQQILAMRYVGKRYAFGKIEDCFLQLLLYQAYIDQTGHF